MNVQFIEENGIPAFAVLPIDEFNRLIQPLEDAADASAIEPCTPPWLPGRNGHTRMP